MCWLCSPKIMPSGRVRVGAEIKWLPKGKKAPCPVCGRDCNVKNWKGRKAA